jgi:hypothetical protein
MTGFLTALSVGTVVLFAAMLVVALVEVAHGRRR